MSETKHTQSVPHVMGVTLTAETVIAMRDALIRNDVAEAYHQLYQAVDPAFCRYEPWADTEAQLRPALTPLVMGAKTMVSAEQMVSLLDTEKHLSPATRVCLVDLVCALEQDKASIATTILGNECRPRTDSQSLSAGKFGDRTR